MDATPELPGVFRALSDPTRLAIFEFLCCKSSPVAVEDSGTVHPVVGATVGEVCCHITGGDKFNSTVSHHLRELRLAGLITAERQGRFMVCSVRRDAIEGLHDYFCDLVSIPAECDSASMGAEA